jgi:hypothetical protein
VLHAATGSPPGRRRAFADPGAADAIAATVEEASSTALFKAVSDCTGDPASLNCEGYWESYCRFRIVPFFAWLPKNGERHPIPIPKPAASIGPGADSAMNAKSDVRMPPESIWTMGELRNTVYMVASRRDPLIKRQWGDAAIRRNREALEIRYCSKTVRSHPPTALVYLRSSPGSAKIPRQSRIT